MAEHKTIGIDFDGVLAYYDGWKGPIPGEPIKGALYALLQLKSEGWKIVIFTSRGEDYVKEWLDKYAFPYDSINENPDSGFDGPKEHISHRKPYFNILIDDRSVCFNGNWTTALRQIKCFRPWWDKGKKDSVGGLEVGDKKVC